MGAEHSTTFLVGFCMLAFLRLISSGRATLG